MSGEGSAQDVIQRALHDLRVKVTGVRPDLDDHCGIVTNVVLEALDAAGYEVVPKRTTGVGPEQSLVVPEGGAAQ